jgi:hypothetical protein
MQQACAHAEAPSASSGSWLYMLERFEIGLVHIDRELRVVGMNDVCAAVPEVRKSKPEGTSHRRCSARPRVAAVEQKLGGFPTAHAIRRPFVHRSRC